MVAATDHYVAGRLIVYKRDICINFCVLFASDGKIGL